MHCISLHNRVVMQGQPSFIFRSIEFSEKAWVSESVIKYPKKNPSLFSRLLKKRPAPRKVKHTCDDEGRTFISLSLGSLSQTSKLRRDLTWKHVKRKTIKRLSSLAVLFTSKCFLKIENCRNRFGGIDNLQRQSVKHTHVKKIEIL